ncbi:MAG: cobaltochelatase subunit CobN [Rhodospirillales bacterium]|jgi:cobaltochelatase CobN|nr:cobaltochelatase subunit CobN [Rhodospirillales bacterium]MBT4625476.1 cobaltochelatase subunit CobN [Rhodospirillales bacterium]MBT5352114.1 cobaltochelatase subunit CobN [Rhodospirillales bacterium]MBT5521883.1 cobaltochelatase subunit CobN [Rhodospirillales bacterium]MBT6109796.1 cobaltochelatase subunit CobN [Rhodospirillales bacterium]
MHLLAAQPGAVSDGSEAIDLGQSPGDIIVLSAADTELSLLAQACGQLTDNVDGFPSVRLANIMHLAHNMSVDLYVDDMIRSAKLVVVRLLGGRGYWSYGVEQVAGVCAELGIPVAFLPGDDQPDAELNSFTSLAPESTHRLWQYCVHGGLENALSFMGFCADLIDHPAEWQEPRPLVRAGLYWPGETMPDVESIQAHWKQGAPVAAIIFYRALVQAGNTAVVDTMIASLQASGLNPLPIFSQSLKDPVAAAVIEELMATSPPSVILNATGFAVSAPGQDRTATPFDDADCPILQVVFSGSNKASWEDGTHGLSARDIAMNVALPEVDGRLFSRAVSFKGSSRRDALTETDIVAYEPVDDRVSFVAELAAAWANLRDKKPGDRRVALILANYPNRDGRLGNGVGLDTPAATINVLNALQDAGYQVSEIPASGDDLVRHMQAGPTNDFTKLDEREIRETFSFADYQLFFSSLPQAVQDAVINRWGAADQDPFYRPGDLDCGKFLLPAFRCGNVIVGVQPARGYNIDPVETYHDPDLVPPHNYFAFYAWLRLGAQVDAVVHMGKHGNLEWLPGKAIALSSACYPEAVLGPMPNIYPFIVNDPGEGTQAKRRAQAVIIDHLTPPLTRAESYGPLRDLEQLVDEYYEASGVDPRRLVVLKKEILTLCAATGVGEDCGFKTGDGEDTALAKLDNYLCELKELQIRDGLHVFGDSPTDGLLTDLLVALIRVPRNSGKDGDASILRALADDLNLRETGFDPLDCEMGVEWVGPKPGCLNLLDEPWRSNGDTVERLEMLSSALVSNQTDPDASWSGAKQVLDNLDATIRPAVMSSGAAEITGLLRGLGGRFVEPGPSGAPTRGRPDVLPTGRNFYSVDTRTVPTPAAWTLGWKSADLLLETYRQEHGEWPTAMAVTAWGTSNMRTGGDDIAQALALMGVRPTWDTASRRVTGFEVLPQSVLGRPRVDVTLRVSGFFRDAFPALIDLVDSAVRAVAVLDEDETENPLAARVRAETARLVKKGTDPDVAEKQAGYRVFGSMPGAYGAGLQALIDEKGWETDADLARAYVAWGGYAYGSGAEGETAHGLFEERLKRVDAVVQNQDNREHDILDSDDYYQFEGGMTAAVRVLSGAQPTVYHNDHSRPETPRVRTLEDEVGRIVRARVVNPKWINGVMRHGYKGVFEMAATVDYLFSFAATARCVKDHHFDAVFDAYLGDDTVRDFMAEHNPAAMAEMIDRLIEAQERGLWKPRRNDTRAQLEEFAL